MPEATAGDAAVGEDQAAGASRTVAQFREIWSGILDFGTDAAEASEVSGGSDGSKAAKGAEESEGLEGSDGSSNFRTTRGEVSNRERKEHASDLLLVPVDHGGDGEPTAAGGLAWALRHGVRLGKNTADAVVDHQAGVGGVPSKVAATGGKIADFWVDAAVLLGGPREHAGISESPIVDTAADTLRRGVELAERAVDIGVDVVDVGVEVGAAIAKVTPAAPVAEAARTAWKGVRLGWKNRGFLPFLVLAAVATPLVLFVVAAAVFMSMVGGSAAAIRNSSQSSGRITATGIDGVGVAAFMANFRGDGLRIAIAAAMVESGGNPNAHNTKPPDNSYGLWQINMLGSLGPARRERFHLSSNEDLFDPLTNARVAYELSAHGTDWGPWTSFTSGAYRNFLAAADDVIARLPQLLAAERNLTFQRNPSIQCGHAWPFPGLDPSCYPWEGAPDGVPDTYTYLQGECVSFAAWALANDGLPHTVDFRGLHNAIDWFDNATARGAIASSQPQVGDIAWWGTSIGPLGHVAYVAQIYPNGTILIYEYNFFEHHQFDQRIISARNPEAFLRF